MTFITYYPSKSLKIFSIVKTPKEFMAFFGYDRSRSRRHKSGWEFSYIDVVTSD